MTGAPEEPQEPAHEAPSRERPSIPERALVGIVAAGFAVIDALLVHGSGRPLPVALAAGAVMGVFVFFSLRRVRRRLAARKAPPAPTPEGYRPPATGGWANPRKGQRLTGRLARAFTRPGSEMRNPLGGPGAGPGRGPRRPGPRGFRDRDGR